MKNTTTLWCDISFTFQRRFYDKNVDIQHKSKYRWILGIIIIIMSTYSEGYSGEIIPLWKGKAPGSETWTHKETSVSFPGGRTVIRNVVDPSLTVYLPEPDYANDVAVIICPGGALRFLSMESASATAKWLNKQGFAAFVLKYRLLKTDDTPQMRPRSGFSDITLNLKNANANPFPDDKAHSEIIRLATLDGQQAIRLVRRNAKKWSINPSKIGIMGFSAGGGVAVGTALLDDREVYPDFVVSLYGPSLVDVHVPDNAPPLFIAVAANHKPVSLGCVALYSLWNAAGKSAELHVYAKGGAFGIEPRGLPSDTWTDRFLEWIKGEGFLKTTILGAAASGMTDPQASDETDQKER